MAQHINLYQAAPKRSATGFSRTGLAVLALLTLATVGVLHWADAQDAAQLRAELDRLRKERERVERKLAALPATSAAATRFEAEQQEVVALEQIAGRLTAGALSRADSFTAPLRALARSSTDGVWLTGIKIDNNQGALTLEGRAIEPQRVPALIDALRKEKEFAGLAFSAIELKAPSPAEQAGKSAAVQFRIRTPDTTAATAPALAAAASSGGTR